jgi:hypothetical protein
LQLKRLRQQQQARGWKAAGAAPLPGHAAAVQVLQSAFAAASGQGNNRSSPPRRPQQQQAEAHACGAEQQQAAELRPEPSSGTASPAALSDSGQHAGQQEEAQGAAYQEWQRRKQAAYQEWLAAKEEEDLVSSLQLRTLQVRAMAGDSTPGWRPVVPGATVLPSSLFHSPAL